MPAGKVQKLLSVRAQPSSLDMPVGDETTPLGAFLKVDAPSPEDLAVGRDLQTRLTRRLAPLSPRERDVIRLRYGIGTDHEHTHEEIGRRFTVSRERIRQIEAEAMRKLRRASA
jgi:RNA polymerase primary sigma factor